MGLKALSKPDCNAVAANVQRKNTQGKTVAVGTKREHQPICVGTAAPQGGRVRIQTSAHSPALKV